MKVVQLLGSQGFWQHQILRGLGGWGSRKYSALEGYGRSSLVAQMVKCLPAMWETWVQSLGWEDPLEKGMATHSSILAYRIPRTEELGGLQSMGLQRV